MAVNRSAVITKLHKVLKKHYQPTDSSPARSLLENLLFAACLENAPYDVATQAYQSVSTAFFDWNEVRVSTVKELSEVMRALPDAQTAANHLRRTLQSVFEANYSFDLEPMKKLNLGQAVQKLSSYDGVTPFAVSYVIQHSLGGHSIPLDSGAMGALAVIGLTDENDTPKDGCAGLERAIPKNKGIEFGTLLHQLAVDFHANPFSTNLHKILLEVDPEAKSRLPKRQPRVEKKPEPAPSAAAKPGKAEAKADAKSKATDEKKAAPAASAKKPAGTAPNQSAKKPSAPVPAVGKKPPTPAKKPASKPATPAKGTSTIAKRKPR